MNSQNWIEKYNAERLGEITGREEADHHMVLYRGEGGELMLETNGDPIFEDDFPGLGEEYNERIAALVRAATRDQDWYEVATRLYLDGYEKDEHGRWWDREGLDAWVYEPRADDDELPWRHLDSDGMPEYRTTHPGGNRREWA